MKHMLSCFVILQMAAIAGAQTAGFEDTVDQYFRETKLVTQQFKELWNYDLYAPLLIVDRNTREVYANVQDTMEQLKKKNIIYTGILPASVNIANTSVR